MLQTLIDIERERLLKSGYDAVVAMDEIQIFHDNCVVPLGNDSVIITKIVFDEDTVYGDNPRITMTSPYASMTGSARNLSAYAEGMFKVMRDYLVVKRLSTSTPTVPSLPMTINVVRISPKKIE